MFLKHTFIPFLWALLILALCGLPGNEFPDLSFWQLLSFDKFAHAFVFAVLVVLLIVGLKKQRTYFFLRENAINTSLVYSVFYGGLVEVLQQLLFLERSADWVDFIANGIGCLIGLLSFYIIYVREIKDQS